MKRISFPTFNADLCVYAPGELSKFEKKYGVERSNNERALSCENGIWVSEIDLELITHECSHFIDWVLEDWLSMKIESLTNSGELRAYAIGRAVKGAVAYLTS